LVAQTRNEKGCVNYDLHQSQEDTREFAIYENWDNATDLDAHAKSAHLQAFARVAGHQLERPAEIKKIEHGFRTEGSQSVRLSARTFLAGF
jgi:quinol monooxygenase YgiN